MHFEELEKARHIKIDLDKRSKKLDHILVVQKINKAWDMTNLMHLFLRPSSFLSNWTIKRRRT